MPTLHVTRHFSVKISLVNSIKRSHSPRKFSKSNFILVQCLNVALLSDSAFPLLKTCPKKSEQLLKSEKPFSKIITIYKPARAEGYVPHV